MKNPLLIWVRHHKLVDFFAQMKRNTGDGNMNLIRDLNRLRDEYRSLMDLIKKLNEDVITTLDSMDIPDTVINGAIIQGKTIVSNIRRMGEGLDRILVTELLGVLGPDGEPVGGTIGNIPRNASKHNEEDKEDKEEQK